MSDQPRVNAVEILDARRVRVSFSDRLTREIDLAPLLWGPMFAEIRDNDAAFAAVQVDPELGTLVWPGGADIDPDVLHGDYPPAEHQNPAA